MKYDKHFDCNIIVKNTSCIIPSEQRIEFEEALKRYEIGLLFHEERYLQALFSTVCFYINAHLTELFICGLLAPAAYDVFKSTIFAISKRIMSFLKNHKNKEENPGIQLKIGKAEIIVPIPNNLSDEQFSIYMDSVRELSKSFIDSEPKIRETFSCFIMEYNDETSYLSIKTINQYGMERIAEQRKANNQNTNQ
jgi:hypothetical protein